MFESADTQTPTHPRSPIDRLLSMFSDVRPGEGLTAALLMANVFLLLVCYSVIKTVREPLILMGGGAEIRSYAAAGQALLLIGFVPLYSWFATRVGRLRLLLSVTIFFLVCIELFAAAVHAGLPYVGVAFFVWVGIFNVSLVAQFWSFASDIYTKRAGDRLFPIIMIGMTAGAPIGSLVASRLFHSGIGPSAILQVAAALLTATLLLYLAIDARVGRIGAAPQQPLASGGAFQLVLGNPYLRLVAALVVILNVVNTTGEYMVAKLLSLHVAELAQATAGFDAQAYIGAFSGEYQFWVNVSALLIQMLVTARVVKHTGLRGALLALPLIALGGYAIVAAGVGFSVVRWIKTAENATDYSLMNTARQLLWLPTSREDKYKAKQAIDTFCVRGGDVLSAGLVYVGATVLQLSVAQFAAVNVVLTLVWLVIALRLLGVRGSLPRITVPAVARATAAVALILAVALPAAAQETRQEQVAARQAEKATVLHPYEPDTLERRLERVDSLLFGKRALYPFIGSVLEGGGLAVGPGYRTTFGDAGSLDAHAAWSLKNYTAADVRLVIPSLSSERIEVGTQARWLDAPDVAFYGTGRDTLTSDRAGYSYGAKTVGAFARVEVAGPFAFGGGADGMWLEAAPIAPSATMDAVAPAYARTQVFAEVDTRTAPRYTRRGGLYRIDWSNYHQTNGGSHSFTRLDAEAQHFIPVLRENWVIALRALASTTTTADGNDVPYFLMPDLGGSHSLRGYPARRFRDRNSLLLTGEYRWTAGPFVDMALFLDAGTVAPSAHDLGRRFTKTYGIGLSLHTLTTTVTRFEVARTPDGTRLVLAFGPSF